MVLKLTMTATLKEINAKLYTDAVFKGILASLEDGALTFFYIATSIMADHVDTGMAISSYTGLAKYLNAEITGLNKRWIYDPPKKYKPPGAAEMPKLPESGAQLSAKETELFIIDIQRKMARFNFYTDVWHYKLNDPVWESISKARDAMFDQMRYDLSKFPEIDRFMIKYHYRTLDSGSILREKVNARRQFTGGKNRYKRYGPLED